MGEFNEKLCNEKHENIKKILSNHEDRLNDHGGRIDKLEQDGREFKIEIKNLCKQVGDLVTTLKWFIGLLVGGFVTFFFYAIQSHLF